MQSIVQNPVQVLSLGSCIGMQSPCECVPNAFRRPVVWLQDSVILSRCNQRGCTDYCTCLYTTGADAKNPVCVWSLGGCNPLGNVSRMPLNHRGRPLPSFDCKGRSFLVAAILQPREPIAQWKRPASNATGSEYIVSHRSWLSSYLI